MRHARAPTSIQRPTQGMERASKGSRNFCAHRRQSLVFRWGGDVPCARYRRLSYTLGPSGRCVARAVAEGTNGLQQLTAQINIANPATGAQKLIDIEDERKVRIFYDKRMSQEVPVGALDWQPKVGQGGLQISTWPTFGTHLV